ACTTATVCRSRCYRHTSLLLDTTTCGLSPDYAHLVRDVGIAIHRQPDVRRSEGSPNLYLNFRGLMDASSTVDRDTPAAERRGCPRAVRLWQLQSDDAIVRISHIPHARRRYQAAIPGLVPIASWRRSSLAQILATV